MFWSNNSNKKKKDEDREKQIKELKAVFPSIRRPNNDDNLFEIKFVVDNKYSSLRIFIPPDFPLIRPVLQAAGPINHPWLDQFKQVNGSEKLLSWSKNSTLVEVVEESLTALFTGTNTAMDYNGNLAKPPPNVFNSLNIPSSNIATTHITQPIINSSSNSYIQRGSYTTTNDNNNYDSYHQEQFHTIDNDMNHSISTRTSLVNNNYPTINNNLPTKISEKNENNMKVSNNLTRATSKTIPMPDLPSSFPELENLTSIQLERLLSDEIALQAQLNSIESILSIKALIDQMMQTNAENAKKNIEKNQELIKKKKEYDETNLKLQKLVDQYNDKLSIAKNKLEIPITTFYKELKTLKNQLDKDSEEVGTKFVEEGLDVTSFMQIYLDKRSKYHELCAKLKVMDMKL